MLLTPHLSLLKTWLELLQRTDIPLPIKRKRVEVINYYFYSVELASKYLAQHQGYFRQVLAVA